MVMDVKAVRLVVRPHQPVRQFVLACLGVLLIVLGAWIVLDWGHWQYIYDTMAGSARHGGDDSLLMSSQEAAADNETLRERIAILERAAQIDKAAYLQVQAHVGELQDEIFELREELEFYRGVVASARTNGSLRIQGFRLTPLGETGHYHYKLVLTNVVKDDKVAAGIVSARIDGTLNGAASNLDLAALANPGGGELAFRFKHFHRLEGDFTLPEGFRSQSVHVAVREEGARENREERIYEWDKLIE